MTQTKTRWTKSEINTLRRLRKEGKSYEFISKVLKRTPTAAQVKYHHLMAANGKAVNANLRWSETETQMLQMMQRNGVANHVMAEKLHRTPGAIAKKLEELNAQTTLDNTELSVAQPTVIYQAVTEEPTTKPNWFKRAVASLIGVTWIETIK